MLFQLTSSSTIRILGAGTRAAVSTGQNGGMWGRGGLRSVPAPGGSEGSFAQGISGERARGGSPHRAAPAAPFPRHSPGSAGAARRLLLAAAAGLGGLGGAAQVPPQVLGLRHPRRRHRALTSNSGAGRKGRGLNLAGWEMGVVTSIMDHNWNGRGQCHNWNSTINGRGYCHKWSFIRCMGVVIAINGVVVGKWAWSLL